MRFVIAIAMVAWLTTPGHAQGKSGAFKPNPEVAKEEERKKQEAVDAEKMYNEMMKRNRQNEQPAKKADPWGSIR